MAAAQNLEVDDNDSAIGSDAATETTSLASWLTDYRIENGRSYHAERDSNGGYYWGPNDEMAQDHLDLAHHLFTLTFDGKLFLAPLENPMDILDIGTGTGIWAIDVADQYPQATVIGTDLSPIQPSWVPPNCRFEVDDAEADWTFSKNRFDYIHIRSLFGSVKDWPRFYAQCLRHLKPGGYIEQSEYAVGFTSDDGTTPETTTMGSWGGVEEKCFEIFGREIDMIGKMKGLMADAGFDAVEDQFYRWPVGPWPRDRKMKELGVWCREHVNRGLENWCTRALTTALGWKMEQVEEFCAGMRGDLFDPRIHGIHEMRTVVARKPVHGVKGNWGSDARWGQVV